MQRLLAELEFIRRNPRRTLIVLVQLLVVMAGAYVHGHLGLGRVAGRSMEPTLHHDDFFVFVRVTDPTQVAVGDVVIWSLAAHPPMQILKRIVRREALAPSLSEDLLWLEGDNKANSTDSRDHGMMDGFRVRGRLLFAIHWGCRG